MTTKQLHALGLSRRAILGRAEQGTLIRVHHGVYAVGRLPTTPRDRAHGALLAAGQQTGLAGATALALWRTERDWPARFELLSRRDVRIQGLTVRRSQTLLNRDFRRVEGLRVTSPARTVLDLAAGYTEQQLTRVANDLRHRTRLELHELRDVLRRNANHPGARPLTELIGEAQRQPTRSELEDAFKRLIKRHELPMPLFNVELGGVVVDAYYPDHDLIVELDGREVTHADDWRPAFENDRARVVRVMAATGIPTIRFSWNQITRLHAHTAKELNAILEARATNG